ncbi:hypothetical protein [Pseudomonas sp. SLFW]|uniref:hypothetical protein n=1 Tax=Pseudomonas sp. SLFW TaxID=2683259 RepID=UPI00141255B3|nr:hypothetical protein [Pseudomonas sp. SLFW]NBB09524.1 hypothetical protein [Pseudomonas sp. SLFW]
MSTPRTESNADRSERFAKLQADVAAFNEEMHRRYLKPDDPRKVWLPFGLGAAAALAAFACAAAVKHFI